MKACLYPCQANTAPIAGIKCGEPSEYVIHWQGGDRTYCANHTDKFVQTAQNLGRQLSIEELPTPPISEGGGT